MIAAPLGIEEGHHVVDAGCGIGGTAIYLAEKLNCTITGVNVTEPQLEIARKKVREAGAGDRVDFKWADCSRHLPFDDASVDAVVNVESGCHYGDRGQYLREVFRILKPGGRTGAMDWMVPDDLSSGQYAEHIQPLCDAWAVQSLESEATYIQRMHEAGLEVVEFEGFDGKDADNLQLLDRNLRFSFYMLLGGGISGDGHNIRGTITALTTLCAAWRKGHFVLKRYCAKRPEKA